MLPKGAGGNLREPLSSKGIYVFEGYNACSRTELYSQYIIL